MPIDSRKKESKKSVDSEESRRKREQHGVELRKLTRDEKLQKRRALPSGKALYDSDNGEQPFFEENIQSLVKDVWSDDGRKQFEATQRFRKILSLENNPPIDVVVRQGIVPRFVDFCRRTDLPALQFEALWAVTNVASGTSEHARMIVDNGAVPVIAQQLSAENLKLEIREQAIWALGNIAGDSPKYRDLVLAHNVVNPLLKVMNANKESLSLIRNGVWTMSNFCRGKPAPEFELVKKILPALARLIYYSDEEVLTDACWALSYMSDGTNDRIEWVLNAGVCRRVVELLGSEHNGIIVPALRTVGNIVTGADDQTQVVLNCGALPRLHDLLRNNPKKSIKKEACWTISNITAGTQDQIESVLKEGILETMIVLLRHPDFEVRKEAAWAISNTTSGGSWEQIQYIVNAGCLPPLCDMLDGPDARIVLVALEGIENILRAASERNPSKVNIFTLKIEECGGLDKLEQLQEHPNDDIYDKTLTVLESYFELEEEFVPKSGSSAKTYVPSKNGNDSTASQPVYGSFHM